MSKILLVDATNNFIRNYTRVPTLDANGQSNGGVYGFLSSIGKFARLTACDKMVVVWDGPGGSAKRKLINENYKLGRPKPIRINRNYDFEMIDPEKNKINQRIRLAEYLKDLPITELTIPDVEADDVIAYVSHYYADDEKVIASNDKDFFQLLDDKTTIYSPTKKVFLDAKWLKEEYNIHSKNFCLARTIVGDKTDKLPGVPGIGFSRLIKYLPFITEDKKFSTKDVLQFCEKNGTKYERFLKSERVLIDNHKIMQLETPIMSPTSIQRIKECLGKKTSFNATSFRMKLIEDGIQTIGDSFYQPFKYMEIKGRQ